MSVQRTDNYETGVRACSTGAPAITRGINARLSNTLKLMGQNRVRHLAVVRDDAFARMFALKELLEMIHQDGSFEEEMLRDMAMGRMAPHD